MHLSFLFLDLSPCLGIIFPVQLPVNASDETRFLLFFDPCVLWLPQINSCCARHVWHFYTFITETDREFYTAIFSIRFKSIPGLNLKYADSIIFKRTWGLHVLNHSEEKKYKRQTNIIKTATDEQVKMILVADTSRKMTELTIACRTTCQWKVWRGITDDFLYIIGHAMVNSVTVLLLEK